MPTNHHIFPQTPTFLFRGLPGRERVRRAAAPAGTGDCTRRATPRRSSPPGARWPPEAAPWPRPWPQSQYAFSCAAQRRNWLGRSLKRKSRFSYAELGSVAVRAFFAQRSTELAAAAVRAFLAQRSTEPSSVAVAVAGRIFSCAAQRWDRRSRSRSRSSRFS